MMLQLGQQPQPTTALALVVDVDDYRALAYRQITPPLSAGEVHALTRLVVALPEEATNHDIEALAADAVAAATHSRLIRADVETPNGAGTIYLVDPRTGERSRIGLFSVTARVRAVA